MIDRVALRTSAVAALRAAGTLAGERVFSPRDWPMKSAQLPAIVVRTPTESRQSLGRMGEPQFNSIITVHATGYVERFGDTGEADAEADLETLSRQIEDALLRNGQFIYANEVQQFASVDVQMRVSAEGRGHTGQVDVAFAIEVYQAFEPTIGADGEALAPALEGIDLHLDAAAPFDPTGTYPAPDAPPYTPAAAPRTSGPDGRDEGALQIDLPQPE